MSSESIAREYDDYVTRRGDDLAMLRAVAKVVDAGAVLYPGSYVHVSPSFVFPEVVYVDTDRQAIRFFGDHDGVSSLLRARREYDPHPVHRFHGIDYATIPEPEGSFVLLLSLYAGFVSEACGHLLEPGGLLLANNSHGDASMATLDPSFELLGVVTRRDRLDLADPGRYLQPRRGTPPTRDELHRTRRGIAVTKDAKAYLFRRMAA